MAHPHYEAIKAASATHPPVAEVAGKFQYGTAGVSLYPPSFYLEAYADNHLVPHESVRTSHHLLEPNRDLY